MSAATRWWRRCATLFRLPPNGMPMTIMQLAGFPAEVVDSVVSVLLRMAFEFGLWSDGAFPLLVVCEEAHRYAPADRSIGFGPTRKAVSRIAKEGRKYGVFLGLITQRPAELDPPSFRNARPCSPCAWRTTATRRSCARRCRTRPRPARLRAFARHARSVRVRRRRGAADAAAFKQLARALHPAQPGGDHARDRIRARRSNEDFIVTVIDRWRGATMSEAGPARRRRFRLDGA